MAFSILSRKEGICCRSLHALKSASLNVETAFVEFKETSRKSQSI
jgi:hypothetical protein